MAVSYLSTPNVWSFRAHVFFYLGTIRRFSWMTLKCHVEYFMMTAGGTHLRMFLNSCIDVENRLANARGVNGSFQLPLTSMNSLSQTEPTTFSLFRFGLS
jgi:hypothetical protein